MNVKDKILAEMKRQGLSQRQFAILMGEPPQRISEWVKGDMPHGKTETFINKALAVLKMDVVATLADVPPKKPRKPKK